MVYKACPFSTHATPSELHSVHVHEMSSAQHHIASVSEKDKEKFKFPSLRPAFSEV